MPETVDIDKLEGLALDRALAKKLGFLEFERTSDMSFRTGGLPIWWLSVLGRYIEDGIDLESDGETVKLTFSRTGQMSEGTNEMEALKRLVLKL